MSKRGYTKLNIEQRMRVVQYFRTHEGTMTKKDMAREVGGRIGVDPAYLETVHKREWYKDLIAMWDMNTRKRKSKR